MTLTSNEREAFFNRVAAVTEVRLGLEEVEDDDHDFEGENDDDDPEREWTDADIRMAIELGF